MIYFACKIFHVSFAFARSGQFTDVHLFFLKLFRSHTRIISFQMKVTPDALNTVQFVIDSHFGNLPGAVGEGDAVVVEMTEFFPGDLERHR